MSESVIISELEASKSSTDGVDDELYFGYHILIGKAC